MKGAVGMRGGERGGGVLFLERGRMRIIWADDWKVSAGRLSFALRIFVLGRREKVEKRKEGGGAVFIIFLAVNYSPINHSTIPLRTVIVILHSVDFSLTPKGFGASPSQE